MNTYSFLTKWQFPKKSGFFEKISSTKWLKQSKLLSKILIFRLGEIFYTDSENKFSKNAFKVLGVYYTI